MAISQELENAQKELLKQRQRAGVCYVPPVDSPRADDICKLAEAWRDRAPHATIVTYRDHDVRVLVPRDDNATTPPGYTTIYVMVRGQKRLANVRRKTYVTDDPSSPFELTQLRRAFIEVAALAVIEPAEEASEEADDGPTVRTYPTLLLEAYKRNLAAVARVYLLLRAMDHEGRGAVDIDHLRDRLTRKTSAWRIVGWRRMRQILAEGEGVFWTRGNGRLWLHSASRIARALEVDRLTGKPVAIPVAPLLQSISTTKAAIYAAYLAGRRAHAEPIARATIRTVAGVPESTQRHYEQVAGIAVNKTIGLDAKFNGDQEQRRAHAAAHGIRSFVLVDHLDRAGEGAGQKYLARKLPNRFAAPLAIARRGRMRKVNRALIDLVMEPQRGNDSPTHVVRYFPTQQDAYEAYKRNAAEAIYYRDHDALVPAADKPTRLQGASVYRAVVMA